MRKRGYDLSRVALTNFEYMKAELAKAYGGMTVQFVKRGDLGRVVRGN